MKHFLKQICKKLKAQIGIGTVEVILILVVLLALVAKVALAAWVEADLPVVISPDNERTDRLK